MYNKDFMPKQWYDLEVDLDIRLDPLIIENNNNRIYPEEIFKKSNKPILIYRKK